MGQGLKERTEGTLSPPKDLRGVLAALTTSPCSADLYTPDTISLWRSKNNASSAISCLFFQALVFGSGLGRARRVRLAPELFGLHSRSLRPQPVPRC